MIVSCKVSFEAAHYLPDYVGKCVNLHGHRWIVIVGVSGRIGKDGMVLDFVKLKELLQKVVTDKYDHTLLNDIIQNPTAENLVIAIVDDLEYALQQEYENFGNSLKLEFVKVQETPNSMAEWNRLEDNE